jgi:hypothetical protein
VVRKILKRTPLKVNFKRIKRAFGRIVRGDIGEAEGGGVWCDVVWCGVVGCGEGVWPLIYLLVVFFICWVRWAEPEFLMILQVKYGR